MRLHLLAIGILAIALLAIQPAQAQAEGSTATVDPQVYAAGKTYEMTVNVTNLDATQSIDMVRIAIDPEFYTSVSVISAIVYDENGNEQGSWSYRIEEDGIYVYHTGNAALQPGWTLKVTLNITTADTSGVFNVQVTAYNYDINTGTYTIHSEHTLTVMIDAAPPSMTIVEPMPYEDNYYVKVVNNMAYVLINITDTADGVTPINITMYPVTLSNLAAEINGTAASASFEVVESADYYQLINITIDLTGVTYTDGDKITVSFSLTDYVGNTETYTISLTIDNTQPTISVDAVYRDENFTDKLYYNGTSWIANANDNTVYLVFTVADNVAVKVVEAYVNDTPLPLNQANDTYYVILNVSDLGDGEAITVTIKATDYAGNTAETSVTVVRDTQPPVVTINGAEIPDTVQCFTQNTTITLQATDTVSGFGGGIVLNISYLHQGDPASLVNNETIEWPADNETLEVSLTTNSDGQGYYYEVIIKVRDNAGNEATYVYKAVVDNKPPVVELKAIEGASTLNKTYYTNNDAVNVSVSVLDASLVNISIYMDSTEIGNVSGVVANGTTITIPVDLTGLEEAAYTLNITAVDCAGNTTSINITLVVDRTPPSLDTSQSTLDDLNGTVKTATDADETVGNQYTVVLVDNLSPITDLKVYLDGTDVTSNVTVTYDNVTAAVDMASLAEQLLSEGQHNITVTTADAAGNMARYQILYTIDNTPPSVPQDFVVESGWVNGTIHLQGMVADNFGINTIVLAFYNNETGEELANYTVAENVNSTSYDLNGTTVNLAELGIEENTTVKVKIIVTDYAGNTAEQTDPDTIATDYTPPLLDVNYSEYQSSTTFNITVTLIDALSGPEKIVIEGDNINSTIVEEACEGSTCTYIVEITVPGDGSYNITITGYDKAGNMNAATITVILDTAPPTIEYMALNVTGGLLITELNISDPNLAYAKIKVYIDNAEEASLTIVLYPDDLENIKEGYWITNATSGAAALEMYDTWEEFVTDIGEKYVETINTKGVFVAVFDGKILVFGGARTEPATIKVEVCAKDNAGLKASKSETFMMEAGDGVFPVKLVEGWNLVSLPLVAMVKASELPAMISGAEVEAIYVYRNGTWLAYIPNMTEDFELTSKDAVWVKVAGDGYLLAQGKLPYLDASNGTPPSVVAYELPAGGNFVGFTSPLDMSPERYFKSLIDTGVVYDLVYVYDSEKRLWETMLVYDNTTTLQPGVGVWIYLYDAGTLVVPVWYSQQ